MNTEAATPNSAVADELPPTEEARTVLEQARDELDAAMRALRDERDAVQALALVNNCTEHISRALWLLHLAQRQSRSAGEFVSSLLAS